ncbi:uncharacterized protein LOC121008885 [Bufo bufo]|uniref:uncharacterized protein LOC121008885 n=1 Tax=Bufo bufo TaxID=8384 RepID=UPI001ABE2A78|nr:uncharacterized protein LOC121008885 [Bufo bufo]
MHDHTSAKVDELVAQGETIDHHICHLYHLHDDIENRSRRNNERIRGLPESTKMEDLIPTLQGLFNTILERPVSEWMEIDRAHRTLAPINPDPSKPIVVNCHLHYFSVKEEIMRKARTFSTIDFDGATLTIMQDLSCFTLAQRRVLKPMLDLLRANNLLYTWGFPFQLVVRKNGQCIELRGPKDLPLFIAALDLPMIQLPDWYSLPPLPS